MRSALLAGAVAVGLGLSMTAAQAAGEYAKIEGGFIVQSNLEHGAAMLDMEPGFSFGAGFGWHWADSPVIIEAEAFYTEAQHNGSSAALGGFAAMGNVLVNFADLGGAKFFVGGGLGIDQVSYYGEDTPLGFSDSDWVGAWQGILGVSHRYGDVDLQLRYRYHDTFTNAELDVGPAKATRDTEWNHHSVTMGIVFGL